MSDNSELLRNDFISNLANLDNEQLQIVLSAFDLASSNYDISHKPMELITQDGIPEPVKWYLGAKAIQNCSASTLKQYHHKLTNFFKIIQKPVHLVTPNDIRVYLFQYKVNHNVSNATVDHTRVVIHSFYAWCLKNGIVTDNPADKIEHIKYEERPREPLTQSDLELLRWYCKDLREKALVDFLYATGCRVSECAAVTLDDIDWNKRSVIIRHGKGDKTRTVFFNAEAEVSLRKYLDSRPVQEKRLFLRSRKPYSPIGDRAIQEIIKKIGKRAGMKVYPHLLRHTFATEGINSGMPIEKLQKLLGHSKPETTMIYAKVSQDDLQHEYKRIYS